MNIHEYQAKDLLGRFGVRSPRGGLAYSPEQAAYRAREIGGDAWLVKAQIHSGGRAAAGGIRLCHSENEVHAAADALFGKRLVTPQSGERGRMVYRVYVEAAIDIVRELYLGLVLDRKAERVVVVASADGGVEIERISDERAASLVRNVVEPAVGMPAFQAREIAFGLGVDERYLTQTVDTIAGCYAAFEQLDATMVEINPLAISSDGGLYALDALMTFDDNALFRRPAIAELRDKSQEDSRETRAADRGLGYIGLDGNIGCLVNGAGLAMATMDMIAQAGGAAANFLDIGGGASPERVSKAIRCVLADESVEALLINIFAGINRCDWIAEGIVQALHSQALSIPLVVRLAGNRVDEGRKVLARSGLPIVRAGTLAEAAERAVMAAQRHTASRTCDGNGAAAPRRRTGDSAR